MSVTIDISGGGGVDNVTFQPTRHALRLRPAIGGALVELSLSVSRNSDRNDQKPLIVTATVRVGAGPMAHHNGKYLCKVEARDLVIPNQQAGDHTLSCFISDLQIRAVEDLRAAGNLFISLNVSATWATGNPDIPLTRRNGDMFFDVPTGEWIEELEKVDAATHFELLIPITENDKLAKAAHRVRSARDHIREGDYGAAIGEIRKPLDRIRKENRTRQIAQAAYQKTRLDRDQEERWAILTEALFDLLSGEAHDDPGTTEHFTWSRAETALLTATVAGFLGRHVEAQQPPI